jgi:hypothetical protein
MRERVALHGGTLRAGPAAGGGWLVEAILRTAAPRPGGVSRTAAPRPGGVAA